MLKVKDKLRNDLFGMLLEKGISFFKTVKKVRLFFKTIILAKNLTS